ncbi:unnamed protein product [Orchesella dallaii]|uniref:Cysteine-rich DPF motif domain-containing protein 1 n=1 Tax=Orchesella dallaii TaxID=48710 RepID=A0ABP1Q6I4_9HEXA
MNREDPYGKASGSGDKETSAKEKEERKFFECSDCGLNELYDYFGKAPPFCRSIKFLEPSYIVRDPFTPQQGNNANFLLLGSNCSVCSKMTCQECSLFFTKRFCAKCSKAGSSHLPEELRSKKKEKD